jgi:signal transduction histidine kinase
LANNAEPALNPVLDKVVEASSLADETIASVQKFAGQLRPRLLDTLGVCAAIRHEAARFAERTGIICRVEGPEQLPGLSNEASTATFRIFQEALTNVARHASATEVDVKISSREDTLEMKLVDNGKGIDPEALEAPKSLGLLGMKERASLLGGEVTVARQDGRGTVLQMILPMVSSLQTANANPL